MRTSFCDVCGKQGAPYSMTFREHLYIIGGTRKDFCGENYEMVNNAALLEYGRLKELFEDRTGHPVLRGGVATTSPQKRNNQ